MKEKRLHLLIGSVIGLAISVITISLKIYFTPLGEVNGKTIYSHHVRPYAKVLYDNAVIAYTKDKVFFNVMDDLGIVVSNDLIDEECQRFMQESSKNQAPPLNKNSIKRTMLHQKALEYFAEKESPTEDEINMFFERNPSEFPRGLEQEKESIKHTIKCTLGESAYNSYMEQAEQVSIKLY